MPVLANGKTATGRAWVYVRGDQPFGGRDPPAALLHFSRDRAGEHAERHLEGFGGILQADAFSGFNRLYAPERRGGPLVEAACWAHARRKFFVLADVAAKARGKLPTVAPLTLEAVRGIDAIFAVEREINGLGAAERLGARRERSAALVMELEAWMRAERACLSRHAEVAKVMDYMLKRWPAFARFLHDGRMCLTNNAAERALRGIAITGSFCPCRAGRRRPLSLASSLRTARARALQRAASGR